jgi:hypothetical protein
VNPADKEMDIRESDFYDVKHLFLLKLLESSCLGYRLNEGVIFEIFILELGF